MRNKKRVDRVTVEKMIEYCEKIEILIQRFGNDFEKFQEDFAFQMSCGMCIIQIGELTTRLSGDFKEKNSEVEWNRIKGLRNIHVHEYEKVNFDYMLKTLSEDIPALKESLQKIFEQMN